MIKTLNFEVASQKKKTETKIFSPNMQMKNSLRTQ